MVNLPVQVDLGELFQRHHFGFFGLDLLFFLGLFAIGFLVGFFLLLVSVCRVRVRSPKLGTENVNLLLTSHEHENSTFGQLTMDFRHL